MDAVKFERLTGNPIGGKFHTQKIIENRKALQKIWRNRHLLTPKEREIVKQLLRYIQNALSVN